MNLVIFEVYGLFSSRDRGHYRYVGQTRKGVSERLRGHLKRAKAGDRDYPVHTWISAEVAAGHDIEFFILEVCETPQGLDAAEVRWIERLRAVGHNLTNTALGRYNHPMSIPGVREKVGASNRGRKHTAETKAKMSASHRGRKVSAEGRANMSAAQLRKPPPKPESVEKMRVSLSRRMQSDPELRARLSAAAKRQWQDPELRTQASERSRKSMSNPEVRARISASLTGRKISPEVVEKMRLASTGREHTDETRAKISAYRTGRPRTEVEKKGLSRGSHRRWHTNRDITKPGCPWCEGGGAGWLQDEK